MNVDELIPLFSNSIAVIICLVALFCYSVLLELSFLSKHNELWAEKAESWHMSLSTLLASLPLLGLLGTITGLMETFFALSLSGTMDLQELMASGISDAMFTTQLGLALSVPGIIIHTHLTRQVKQYWLNFSRENYATEPTTKN